MNDVESIYLSAKARFEEWKIQFEKFWFEPLLETYTITLYESLSEEQKNLFKELHPSFGKKLDEMINNGG